MYRFFLNSGLISSTRRCSSSSVMNVGTIQSSSAIFASSLSYSFGLCPSNSIISFVLLSMCAVIGLLLAILQYLRTAGGFAFVVALLMEFRLSTVDLMTLLVTRSIMNVRCCRDRIFKGAACETEAWGRLDFPRALSIDHTLPSLCISLKWPKCPSDDKAFMCVYDTQQNNEDEDELRMRCTSSSSFQYEGSHACIPRTCTWRGS